MKKIKRYILAFLEIKNLYNSYFKIGSYLKNKFFFKVFRDFLMKNVNNLDIKASNYWILNKFLIII
jgi:hypothetical protein